MEPEDKQLQAYSEECRHELEAILAWWMEYMTDKIQGGFYGKVDHQNIPDLNAPKGMVLNSRILWTFSAAYSEFRTDEYLVIATRAFSYIRDHFIDPVYGGVYWSVNNKGERLDGKKQIYAQAFCIYGLSEYYKATKEQPALDLAKQLFALIEQFSLDPVYRGYLEAFNQDWSLADDLRLSEKDDNEVKGMNTHLHVLEAYANLYQVWKDAKLAHSIRLLLDIFKEKIIDKKTYHQHLYFAADWSIRSSAISFGHDIEAAWLLQEAAETAGSPEQIDLFKALAVKMADASTEGVDNDGGMWHEYDKAFNQLIKEKHWWPQAEAMVGFLNAWQLTGNPVYFDCSVKSWQFIKEHLKENQHGEWKWGIHEDYSLMSQEDKAGFWKCPYHNGRALLEVRKRCRAISQAR